MPRACHNPAPEGRRTAGARRVDPGWRHSYLKRGHSFPCAAAAPRAGGMPAIRPSRCSPAFARAVFGSANDRSLKGYQRRVPEINAFEPAMAGAVGRGARRPRRRSSGRSLADGAATRFSCCPRRLRWCARRRAGCSGLRHFDVQMIGGMVLHEGKIAEMKTGEGKTLVATLPVYLNALPAKGVHVVTVNDYLASSRQRVDGAGLRVPGASPRASSSTASATRSAGQAYACGHHLRHEQRVRLRLPARQHEVSAWTTWCSGISPTRSSTRWTAS